MFYIGVDLHRKTSHLAGVDEAGELICNRRVISDREEMLRVFGEVGRDQALEVAFEATYGWGWFADLLDDVGIPTHMAHPRANKAICLCSGQDDAVDAKTLAQLLRTGAASSDRPPPRVLDRTAGGPRSPPAGAHANIAGSDPLSPQEPGSRRPGRWRFPSRRN